MQLYCHHCSKIREQQWSIPNFDRNEIEMMVEFICTA